MMKWEQELKREFPLHQWYLAVKHNGKSSACVDHWENAQKILHRWYLTPLRIHKMNLSIQPLCWWKCNNTGNHLHILWSCKVIKSFWKDLTSIIQDVTNTTSTSNPALALLSLGIENFPPMARKIVIHILFAARISLAREWRSQTPPKIEAVISRVNAHYTMEKMLAYKERRAPAFHKNWEIWRFSRYASSLVTIDVCLITHETYTKHPTIWW